MELQSFDFANFLFGALSMLVYLILAFLVQKVVFLESHTRRQFKTYLQLIALAMLILAIVYVVYFLIPPESRSYSTLSALLCAVFIIPFLYSSYTGRKRCKWLALFEFIPVIGCVDGILSVFKVMQRLFPFAVNSILYTRLSPVIFLAVIGFIAWWRPTFAHKLISDIRKRHLAVAEEIVIWLVGIWLFVYVSFVNDRIADSVSLSIQAYICFLNFVASSVIIAYVISSNYRGYYHERNNHLQKSLITAMAELIETRDANTGGHIQRTSQYVEIIARRLQRDGKFSHILTDQYVADMVIAAPLHDVGKIHIPDAILNKPGRLDANEFATMKTHSAAGGTIISHIEATTGDISYLRIAKQMAEYHHERMDGRGYPYGISGEDIPLCARILAVADVFDAVSSKRCYKDAFSLDQSFAIIEEESGSHFDRDVAQAFLDSRKEVEALLSRT